ncbi:putative choline dehydrogenase [Xylogone sp. PMI_703]|nr:putative choline dehydrogenase [Xylogone sp. PMI_703]
MATILRSPEEFSGKTFDYIIIGGGTAGLVVASRLTDDPNISVGVVEAGVDARTERLVKIPGYGAKTIGTEYDWQFETVPQGGFGGRKLPWPRGKMLGGSSAMNLMVWNRGCQEDYDVWEELGNKSWNWESFQPYFKKSSLYTPIGTAEATKSEIPGADRHVRVTYPRGHPVTHQHWHETLNNLGIPTSKSHLDGSNIGVWTSFVAQNSQTGERSYSVPAYLEPIQSRKNLSILTGAQVTKILFEDRSSPLVAKGIQYRVGEDIYQASASKEVIISAGSVGSPQILELSGIGNKEILEKAGISVHFENDSVGENLQEHMMTVAVYELNDTVSSLEHLTGIANLIKAEKEFEQNKTGFLTMTPSSMAYLAVHDITTASQLTTMEEKARLITKTDQGKGSNAVRNMQAARILERQFSPTARLGQVEYILHHGNDSIYFAGQDGKKYVSLCLVLQYPYSVGSIHISIENPTGKPVIDPRYYQDDGGALDAGVMLRGQEFGDRIMKTEPLSSIISKRVWPPESDGVDWPTWIRDTTVTDWHPVGTCAMLPLQQGGVVDHELRVHGTKNVRVIDASIFPLHISAHIQATTYAIAEKGADIIRRTWESSMN